MTRQDQLFSEQEYLQSAIVKADSLPYSEVREAFKNVLADFFR